MRRAKHVAYWRIITILLETFQQILGIQNADKPIDVAFIDGNTTVSGTDDHISAARRLVSTLIVTMSIRGTITSRATVSSMSRILAIICFSLSRIVSSSSPTLISRRRPSSVRNTFSSLGLLLPHRRHGLPIRRKSVVAGHNSLVQNQHHRCNPACDRNGPWGAVARPITWTTATNNHAAKIAKATWTSVNSPENMCMTAAPAATAPPVFNNIDVIKNWVESRNRWSTLLRSCLPSSLSLRISLRLHGREGQFGGPSKPAKSRETASTSKGYRISFQNALLYDTPANKVLFPLTIFPSTRAVHIGELHLFGFMLSSFDGALPEASAIFPRPAHHKAARKPAHLSSQQIRRQCVRHPRSVLAPLAAYCCQ